MTLKLKDLKFSDLYIRLPGPEDGNYTLPARYAPQVPNVKEGILPNMELPSDYDFEIDNLLRVLSKYNKDDFSLDWDGLRIRVSKRTMMRDEEWVAIRRLPIDPPQITKLNFLDRNITTFRSWGRRPSGLILVGGSTGVGKTTTAVALLTEWLKSYGQVAYTIEDPIEYYLQGEHNKDNGEPGGNYVFQTEIDSDDDWKSAMKTALRWKPRYIFVGEVRTSDAAQGILRAATSGHLTICTVHAGNIEETISAIVQNAINGPYGMDEDTAYSLLADGLCGIIHQEFSGGVPKQKIITTNPTGSGGEDKIRSSIRQKNLKELHSHLQSQENIRRDMNDLAKRGEH